MGLRTLGNLGLQVLEFRVLGFRAQGCFRVQGFRAEGLWLFRFTGFGSRV